MNYSVGDIVKPNPLMYGFREDKDIVYARRYEVKKVNPTTLFVMCVEVDPRDKHKKVGMSNWIPINNPGGEPYYVPVEGYKRKLPLKNRKHNLTTIFS